MRWHYRVRLAGDASDRAIKAVAATARAQLPDAGWEIRTRANASPELGRNIERFTQYLTLVGLTSLLIGGVGVANAVKHYLDRKRDVIATLKSVGATGSQIFADRRQSSETRIQTFSTTWTSWGRSRRTVFTAIRTARRSRGCTR